MAVERVLQRCSCISRKWFLVFWLLPLPVFLRGLPRIQHKLSGIPNGGLLRPYTGNHPRKQLCCLRDDPYRGPSWDASQSLGNGHHRYETGRSPALRSLRFQPQQKPTSESRRCLGSSFPQHHAAPSRLRLTAPGRTRLRNSPPALRRSGGRQGRRVARQRRGWLIDHRLPKNNGKAQHSGQGVEIERAAVGAMAGLRNANIHSWWLWISA